MIKRAACMLLVALLLSVGYGNAEQATGSYADAAFEEYELLVPEFEPILMMEYSTKDGIYDISVYLTGVDEEHIYLQLENRGKKAVSFSFSQFMLDGIAYYQYHDWSIPVNQIREEVIEIPADMLRWAGLNTVSQVSLSTPGFHIGDKQIYSRDMAMAQLEAAGEANHPAWNGMELCSGEWGRLELIGIDYRDRNPMVWFRLDNALPSWTKEWATGVTFYSYMSASVDITSVNGVPVTEAARMSQNWVCSSLNMAYLDSVQQIGEIEEMTMNVHLLGGGENDYYDETLELTVRPDREKILIIEANAEE